MSGEQKPWIEGDLDVTKAVMDDIEAHALECYPSECCGFASGPAETPRHIDASVREVNEADKYHKLDPETFPRTSTTYFKINELRAAKAFDSGEANGKPIKVIYHSHCDAGAYFSKEDSATFANAANSSSSDRSTIANAQAVFASSCALNSLKRSFAALASAANSASSRCSAVANAHAVFASSCALNSPRRGFAAHANAANSASSRCSAVANAHAKFAITAFAHGDRALVKGQSGEIIVNNSEREPWWHSHCAIFGMACKCDAHRSRRLLHRVIISYAEVQGFWCCPSVFIEHHRRRHINKGLQAGRIGDVADDRQTADRVR